jgi:oligoendopeptidase F
MTVTIVNPSHTLPHWNLSPLYSSVHAPEIERDIAASRAAADEFATRYEKTIATLDASSLAEALQKYERFMMLVYGPQMFTMLASATNALDDATRAVHTRAGEAATDALNRVRFLDVELASAPDEVFARWKASPELARYQHFLDRSRLFAPHTLSREVENVLATKNLTGRRAWTNLYDELTAAFSFEFEVRGDTRTRTLSEMRGLRMDSDRDVRARAHAQVLERFQKDSSVIAYIVNTLYQDHRMENDLRGYNDPVAPTLLDDELPRKTLDALMTAVEEHYVVAQEYFSLKARALGIEKLATHDVLAPYPSGERSVSWEDARTEVVRAFGDVDSKLGAIAEAFFVDQRIDAEPRAGKRDGAFCSGMLPGVAPRVLLNYNGRLSDVMTLAHELGHGVHFALAGEKQNVLNYWPSTPMAETASVFGEMMLAERLLEREHDGAVRRQLLAARIEDALGTVHRQVCFTRYEMNAHARRGEGVVSTDDFCRMWSHELTKFYGDSVVRGEKDVWGWAGIPHLVHYRFYCYSYAFGQLLVFALYAQWKRDGRAFVPKYLALLESGGCDTPHALLARVGIDVTDPDFWRRGLEVVTQMVAEFKALV